MGGVVDVVVGLAMAAKNRAPTAAAPTQAGDATAIGGRGTDARERVRSAAAARTARAAIMVGERQLATAGKEGKDRKQWVRRSRSPRAPRRAAAAAAAAAGGVVRRVVRMATMAAEGGSTRAPV